VTSRPHSTVADALTATAQRYPGAPALTFLDAGLRERAYTYRSLWNAVGKIASALAAARLPPRAPVGILLQTQESQTLHYLAALSTGLVPAILTPPNRKLHQGLFEQTLRATVRTCGFSAIFSDLDLVDLNVTVLEPFSARRRSEGSIPTHAVPADVALLQFSSGTTGIKRGVTLADRAVLNQIRSYGDAIGLSPGDRILSWLPLYHDMGFIACLNMPLATGAHCIMINPMDWVSRPALFMHAASKYRATLSWNPNFAYAFMANRIAEGQSSGVDLSSLRGLVNCSEPATQHSQGKFAHRFAPNGLRADVFWGCYAMAETTFAVTHCVSSDTGYLDGTGPTRGDVSVRLPQLSVGRPIPGVELRVLGEDGGEMPERAIGELFVSSPFSFGGYFNNAEDTASVTSGAGYRTGDLGYRVGDHFFVSGRRKELIIVSGTNVYAQDAEEIAAEASGVIAGRVVAFSEFDDMLQTERLVILAETDQPADRTTEICMAIRQRIASGLSVGNFEVHLIPARWLVKSSSGKISRIANREKWRARVAQPK